MLRGRPGSHISLRGIDVEEGQYSPRKKDAVPSYRRKFPAFMLFILMLVTLTSGIALHSSYKNKKTAQIAKKKQETLTAANSNPYVENHKTAENSNSAVRVEFSSPNNYVLLADALKKQPLTVHHASLTSINVSTSLHSTSVRILIAITSSCCHAISFQRRDTIRKTWASLAKKIYPDHIDIKFFLSQPRNLSAWQEHIAREVASFNDTVILQGEDSYRNLYNKVFGMLRYAMAHPHGYSHVLKVDDDTWVRPHRVMDALHDPDPRKDPVGVITSLTSQRAQRVAALQDRLKAQLTQKSVDSLTTLITDSMILDDASMVSQRSSSSNSDDGGMEPKKNSVNDPIQDYHQLHGVAINSSTRGIEYLSNSSTHGIEYLSNSSTHGIEYLSANDSIVHSTNASTYDQYRIRRPRMHDVYLGCIEVDTGFMPIRDPSSKWYISYEDVPDDSMPVGVKYLAGWGYALSRDLIQHIVEKVNSFQVDPSSAPIWFTSVKWEDVLVGLLLSDVTTPQHHPSFRPAWRSCSPETAVRHLDVDSPRLLPALVAQDISGLADVKPVQCSSGTFDSGDYFGWLHWKQSLEE